MLIETQELSQFRKTTNLSNCLEEENGREKEKSHAIVLEWKSDTRQTSNHSFREGSPVSGKAALNTQKEDKEKMAFLSNSGRCTELYSCGPVSYCAVDRNSEDSLSLKD